MSVLAIVSCAAVGCSASFEPQGVPTLLVVNATCDSGPCRTLYVSAFVPKWRVPQPPAGYMDLGVARSQLTCFAFPRSRTLTVRGDGDTVSLVWMLSDGLYVNAIDSARQDSGGSYASFWVGTTARFVPADARGWTVRFPSGEGMPPPEATVERDSACAP